MAGRVAGKVAFVTGAARGQGRSHAIRLAEEGADIIAVDVLQDYETVSYGMGTQQDLADTVEAVATLGRKIIARKADVRDAAAIRQVVDEGVGELGKLDIAVANAGISTVQAWDEVTPAVWQDTIDTNLTGVWHTIVAAIPHLIRNDGGSIYMNALAVDPIEPRDVSNAVLFLASDEARYVTGLEFTVDAGCTIR
jgi:NAD(P)-dependent dehydrogenase (short-subunit alcohol dehydrogenase family)